MYQVLLLIYWIHIARGIDYVGNDLLSPRQAADLVKEQFIFGYSRYKKYGWECDEYYTLGKDCHNFYPYSLLWTAMDSIDTLYLMNLTDLLNDTINLLCNDIKPFTFYHNHIVDVFDLFIRNLGGLLSGYYFTNNECLKNLAINLGNILYNTFDGTSTTGLPWQHINMTYPFTINYNANEQRTSPAGIASNILEFGILSVITNDLKYFNVSKNLLKTIYSHRSPITGLYGGCININASRDSSHSNFWCSNRSFISGGIDSFYEYQLKCWLLFNDEYCLKLWNESLESIMKYLSYYDNSGRLWFKQVDMNNGNDLGYDYDVYSAFFSGALSLSNHLNLSKSNQEANWYFWTKYDIEPFTFNFKDDSIDSPQGYALNPENIESNYYLYMITNDTLYYKRAIQYLYSLINYTKCDNDDIDCAGYTGLRSVETKSKNQQCPSWFFGETLKYLYLTFMRNEDDNPLKYDEFVYNTEAHPLPKSWGFQLKDMISSYDMDTTDIGSMDSMDTTQIGIMNSTIGKNNNNTINSTSSNSNMAYLNNFIVIFVIVILAFILVCIWKQNTVKNQEIKKRVTDVVMSKVNDIKTKRTIKYSSLHEQIDNVDDETIILKDSHT